MKTKTYILTVVAILAVVMTYFTVDTMANRGNDELGVVYVTSQCLYYDTFVPVDVLPYKGRFQHLIPGEPSMTEFGPGDPGYVGGRWWIDANGNGYMDPPGEEGDVYLLCPLLPPGREEL